MEDDISFPLQLGKAMKRRITQMPYEDLLWKNTNSVKNS